MSLGVMTMSGCVVPPNITEAPPPPNEPPVILRDDVIPEPGGSVTVCPDELLFVHIPVSDANVTDTLTLRLFVDDAPVHTGPGTQEETIRTFDAGLDGPCSRVTMPTGMPTGLLEAIVSDRGFIAGGRDTPAGAGTASLVWQLMCPPACQLDGGG